MDNAEFELDSFIREAVRVVLNRTPNLVEMENFTAICQSGSPIEFLRHLETLKAHATPLVATHWPNGHYYSPVVSPNQTVRQYWESEQMLLPSNIEGINLDLNDMISFWDRNSDYLLANPFPKQAGPEFRYGSDNPSFPGGDAVFVGAMMRSFIPKRIIEIGSGNSTACMLDWRDRLYRSDLQITCIEPDPVRLREILRPDDRVTIVEDVVQNVPLQVFDDLEADDILFIDSTHILKTGSDVHYELFRILPRLRPGVLIHFHDCAYPFEYPQEAVFEMNFSWNEAYAVRSFLMYNSKFSVVFWNSMFYRLCPPPMREIFATLSANPGGGLWIRKQTW